MTSLLDIGRLSKKVMIRDVEVEVFGLTARDILNLLEQSPELRKIMTTAKVAIDPAELMAQAPGAVAGAIAACVGHMNEDEYLKLAERLSAGEQFEILRATWDLTFPKGIQSFREALINLPGRRTKSGWGQAMPSREGSKS